MIASDIDGYWGEMEVDYHSALQDGIPSPPKDPANMGGQSHLSQKYGSSSHRLSSKSIQMCGILLLKKIYARLFFCHLSLTDQISMLGNLQKKVWKTYLDLC